MPEESATSTQSTSTPPLISSGQYKGQKIDKYGLGEIIIKLLSMNTCKEDVLKILNKEIAPLNKTISKLTLIHWLNRLDDETKKMIVQSQHDMLRQQAWDFERKGLEVRNQASNKIQELIDSVKDIDELTVQQKKDLSNIVKKKVDIQESGERMMGIGTNEGQRYKLDINVNIDIVDELRELVTKRMKKKAIDIESEDVP